MRAATTARTQVESSIDSSASFPVTRTIRRHSTSWILAIFANTLVISLDRAGPRVQCGHYAYISAFCGWAVREGHLAENVAQRRNATEPIPDDGGHKSGDQQAWSAENRQQLTGFVDEQAGAAIDDVGEEREAAIKTCRDRALIYLLSYSGVREQRHSVIGVMNVGKDSLDDIHLEDRYATVLPKSSVSAIEASPQSSDSSATDVPESPQRTERPLSAPLVGVSAPPC